jgi:hypothetical protein
MVKFDQKPDLEKKRIIQTIFPKIVYFPERNELELTVNTDPNGSTSPEGDCHRDEGEKVRFIDKWRRWVDDYTTHLRG